MNEILQKQNEEAAKKIIQEYVESYRYENGMELEPPVKIFLEKIGNIFFKQGISFALQNQWISVEEALPLEQDDEDEQYSTNVFARTKDCIRYAYYDFYNKSWYSVEGGYRFSGDVTHWMPIPSLKGGKK